MTQPVERSPWHTIALLLARVSLGLYLIKVSAQKMFVAGQSLGQSYDAWMTMFHKTTPGFVPTFIATPYGYALPWLEMLIGILLVLGLFFRTAAVAAMLLLLSIYIALTAGGGGVAHHSLVFATFAFLLVFTGPGNISLQAMFPRRRRRG